MTTLYLVRHGQTEINAAGRFNGGGVDSPLTAKGVAGAKQVRDLLQPLAFDRVFVSSLPRAVATATLVVGEKRALTIDPRLREMSLGDWDGQLLADWADHPEFIKYRHHLLAWDHARFHAESYPELVARCRAAFADIVAATGPNGRALVVSHGIVLTVMANVLTGVPLDHARDSGEVANTSVTVLHTDGTNWEITAWNVTPETLPNLSPTQRALFE